MNGDTLLTQTGDSAALPAPADPWDGMPPGSDNALDWGCTCPVIENRGGRGCWAFEGEMHYWMAETCPLHGFTVQEASDD